MHKRMQNEYSPHFPQGFPQKRGKSHPAEPVEKWGNGMRIDENGKMRFVKGFWNIHSPGFSTIPWKILWKVVICAKFAADQIPSAALAFSSSPARTPSR
jgi:hypothetical protein